MIKNIVFDMGNVLVRFDPELFMNRYSLTGEDRKLIRNEVFRSVEWTMLDRGVIDEEIAEQHILPRLPERLHDAARGLIEKWDDPIVPVEGMLELLQALKAKGYRLYLLSNAATRQPIYWARAEASKLMDGALISAEVKLLKPDPQIYRTFLHKFALRPEECVFIDDTPINVEGALYENMAGIVFNMDVAALPRVCVLWAWNGKVLIGEMLMMIWIGLMLLICAGFSAYAGASQLEKAKQRAKCSLDAFTERRNGVSCICLAILFVILGIGINL